MNLGIGISAKGKDRFLTKALQFKQVKDPKWFANKLTVNFKQL